MKDLKFLGIGGATAVELGNNSAFLKDKDRLFLIDCGEGTTRILKEKNLLDGVKEIVVAITHTHADHMAGLGVLSWYVKNVCGIKLNIVSNSKTFEKHLRELLEGMGSPSKYYNFVMPDSVTIDGCKIEMQSTRHEEGFECFGIMFEDRFGKYYYTGDTNDFEYIKNLASDEKVKRIYCEVRKDNSDMHICIDKLKTLACDKFVLMHFQNKELMEEAEQLGFKVAKRI